MRWLTSLFLGCALFVLSGCTFKGVDGLPLPDFGKDTICGVGHGLWLNVESGDVEVCRNWVSTRTVHMGYVREMLDARWNVHVGLGYTSGQSYYVADFDGASQRVFVGLQPGGGSIEWPYRYCLTQWVSADCIFVEPDGITPYAGPYGTPRDVFLASSENWRWVFVVETVKGQVLKSVGLYPVIQDLFGFTDADLAEGILNSKGLILNDGRRITFWEDPDCFLRNLSTRVCMNFYFDENGRKLQIDLFGVLE